MTTTAIIGLGNMGKGLAKRLAGKTDLVLGSRDPGAAASFAASLPAQVDILDQDAAIARADIVILALPFDAALEAAGNPALRGKILVDIINPLKPDFSGLTIGHTTSASEQLQQASSAKVVKAYNTIFASVFDLPPEATAGVPVFLAGNDPAAVEAVSEIVKLSGFGVQATGALDAARLLEPLGMLNVRLAFSQGQGTAMAPGWIQLQG